MINFMRFKLLYFLISLVVIVPGVFSLLRYGLNLSIDFTGGSLLEIRSSGETTQNLNFDQVQNNVKDLWQISSTQSASSGSLLIKGVEIANEQKEQVVASLSSEFGAVEVLRFERVGAVISGELIKKTVTGIVLVAGAILWFVARQFKQWKFGVAAILAMLHDSLVLLGVFSILGKTSGVQVDVLFVTALLTTLSFSVHDTIVVFHRIRELMTSSPKEKIENVLNLAITQTLSRSINNSVTIFTTLLSLTLLGGSTIHYFALALFIGSVTGTFSSSFTAVPLLLVLSKVKKTSH
jgi:preprotein translocase subunit SecF